MVFAEPSWLWSLLALPLIAAGLLWGARRDRERTARLVARPLWTRVLRRAAEHWRYLRLALLLVGAAGVALALARPQWGVVRERVEREGVDVVLVLDTSGSMATEDVPPTRFFLARAALLSLISQLDQDRFALVAFEGEAYPLVPLTLDADAVGLFLETLEPGFVPGPGSSLGEGISRGLDLFVDEGRRNKVMVLVSDGENLEGVIEPVIRRARESGVVVHAVGVGTERGQPVPDFDENGERAGFKRAEDGSVVVSRLDARTLQAIADGTGGKLFQIGPADASLRPLAAAVDAMEERTLAREFAYRKKDRFQLPLGIALAAFTLALLLPPPRLRGAAAAALLASLVAVPGRAQQGDGGSVTDELLLRPSRLTAEGLERYAAGDHPAALESFEAAAAARAEDPTARFNLADALYKNGRFEDAAAIYGSLGQSPELPVAGSARFNLGNALFERQDYPGAIAAYRDALELLPGDEDARRNLELALRRLQEQQQQQQQQQQDQQDQQDQGEKEQQQQRQQEGENRQQEPRRSQEPQRQEQKAPQPGEQQPRQPQTAEQREQARFEREAGMPKERAMQLLDALQENEKEEQRRILAARQAERTTGKDW
jgi:Ca-activated chloride channel family protein